MWIIGISILIFARYYDPQDGRFITQDTYRGEQDDPSTWNLYTYCANDPINRLDPSGHFGITYWNQKDCPYGKAADYTKFFVNKNNPNIPLTKKLSAITSAGLSSVVAKFLPYVGLGMWIATSIKSLVDKSNGSSKYLSYKAKIYFHKKSNGGWIGGRYIEMYKTTWFTKINYGGKHHVKSTYRIGVV